MLQLWPSFETTLATQPGDSLRAVWLRHAMGSLDSASMKVPATKLYHAIKHQVDEFVSGSRLVHARTRCLLATTDLSVPALVGDRHHEELVEAHTSGSQADAVRAWRGEAWRGWRAFCVTTAAGNSTTHTRSRAQGGKNGSNTTGHKQSTATQTEKRNEMNRKRKEKTRHYIVQTRKEAT